MTVSAFEYRLFLYPPTTVFAARVNQATFDQSIAQLTFDGVTTGAYGDIEPGMTLLLGSTAGADDHGRQRIRKAATSSVVYVGWSGDGNHDGELTPADDDYITVLKDWRVWTKVPRIDTATGVSYMDYDLDYATYGKLKPVIHWDYGPAIQKPIVAGVATFAFDASASYKTDPDSTATLTYAYTLPAGVTVTAGATNTHSVTFTMSQQAAWVKLVVTDSQGTTATRRILCIAGEPSGVISNFEITEHVLRQDGVRMRVRINESIPESTYPDGTLAVIWQRQTENGAVVTPSGVSGREHMVLAGWHQSDDFDGRADEYGYITDTEFELVDVAGRMQTLPNWPTIIECDSAPAKWQQIKTANIDLYYIHLLQEYSTALTFADFTWSGLGATEYPFSTLGSNGGNLWDQVAQRAEAIAHVLTCDYLGRLAILPDPMRADPVGTSWTPTNRTATVQKALTEALWTSVRYTFTRPPRVHWINAGAIGANGGDADTIGGIQTVWCVAPGVAPGQGVGSSEFNEALVSNQAELNARIGHDYARENAETGLAEVELAGSDDYGINPAYMTWVTLLVSSSTDGERGRTISTERFLPHEVQIDHDHEAGTKRIVLRLERETIGELATTVVKTENPYVDYTAPDTYYPPVYVSALDGNDMLNLRGVSVVAAFLSDNTLRITSNFKTIAAAGGPTYSSTNLTALGLGGTLVDFTVDAYSPLYLETGTAVNGWVCTTTQVRRITDIFGSVALGTAYTFAFETPRGGFGGRTMNFERGVQNWGIVASWCGDQGTYAAYTTDGVNWSESQVTAHYVYQSSTTLSVRPGLFISPHTAGLAYISVFTATDAAVPWTTQDCAIYKTPDYGANFALDATCDPGVYLCNSIAVAYQDTGVNYLFYGYHTGTDPQPGLKRNSTVISPTIGSDIYGPTQGGNRAIALSDDNPDLLVLCGLDVYSDSKQAVLMSTNARAATPVWTTLIAPVAIGSNPRYLGSYPVSASSIYLIGQNGRMGYYDGVTVDDRTGNISSSGSVVGICGGG